MARMEEAPREDPYRLLAHRLDSLPNRFPETKSGVELRLLRKIFSPEEAALACAMNLSPETAGGIAEKVKGDPRGVRSLLKRMAAKGLVRLRKGEEEFGYALRPFVVGFYEDQLPRMDAELAGLFEEYFHETAGAILRDTPAHHRVVPVDRAIPFELEIAPYERASALLERARSWGVRRCICRVQQRLAGKGCDAPLESCLVFAPVENAFSRSKEDRTITKDEALQLLRGTEDAGLVHTVGNYRDGIDYICNCCTCCCGILRGVAEYGLMSAVAHSDFSMAVEEERCSGCNACIDRCPFEALTAGEAVVVVDRQKCMGCGLCVVACSTDALRLERRSEGARIPVPATVDEWRALRQESRKREN